jgi:hypothetical protein
MLAPGMMGAVDQQPAKAAAGIGELNLVEKKDFTIGLAFGDGPHAAIATLVHSLARSFDQHFSTESARGCCSHEDKKADTSTGCKKSVSGRHKPQTVSAKEQRTQPRHPLQTLSPLEINGELTLGIETTNGVYQTQQSRFSWKSRCVACDTMIKFTLR